MGELTRLGFVGLGRWGQTLATAARRGGEAEVALGCARTDAAREQFAAEFGCPTVSDVDAVLADPAVDAVVLATPHTTHADLAVRAAQAGKHVFVEKPLALDVAGARRAVDAAAAAGVVLQ
ncbi:MAG: Gfo/Idh/MocA family protein, partial [Natronosporangium sp.]